MPSNILDKTSIEDKDLNLWFEPASDQDINEFIDKNQKF